MAKKQATTIYITELQQQMLRELNRRSKVPVAEFIREGIDLVLQKHRDLLPGQLELGHLAPADSADMARSNAGVNSGPNSSPASRTKRS